MKDPIYYETTYYVGLVQRTYQTKSETPMHKVIRDQYPARTCKMEWLGGILPMAAVLESTKNDRWDAAVKAAKDARAEKLARGRAARLGR
jgi:hypothetical protein